MIREGLLPRWAAGRGKEYSSLGYLAAVLIVCLTLAPAPVGAVEWVEAAAYLAGRYVETKRLAELKVASARDFLGVMCPKGKGVREDDVQAYVWFSIAAVPPGADTQSN